MNVEHLKLIAAINIVAREIVCFSSDIKDTAEMLYVTDRLQNKNIQDFEPDLEYIYDQAEDLLRMVQELREAAGIET